MTQGLKAVTSLLGDLRNVAQSLHHRLFWNRGLAQC